MRLASAFRAWRLAHIAAAAALIVLIVDMTVVDSGADIADLISIIALLAVLATAAAERHASDRSIAELCEAQASLAVHARRQDALRRLGQLTLAGLDAPELFSAAVALIANELGAPYCGLYAVDSKTGETTLQSGVGAEGATTAVGAVEITATIGGNGAPYGFVAVHGHATKSFTDDDKAFVEVVSQVVQSRLRRRRAEEALRANEERLRLALELTHMGTWNVDLSSGATVWSVGLYEIAGLPHDSTPGPDTITALIHPDDRRLVETTITCARARAEDFEVEDFRMCRPNGDVRRVFIRGTWLRDDDGKAKQMLGVALDVTERRRVQEERSRLEEQLRQAQKMEAVGQLAGGIAHDFNNLLLALRGYGEVALRGQARGEDVRDEIEEMLAAADRAGTLTRQLLAFSRRQILQPQRLDLGQVIGNIEKLLGRVIGEDIALTTLTPSEGVWVHADRSQLEQVVANLAVNARDAMPDGGELTLEVSETEIHGRDLAGMPPGRYALIAVADTGCGMDAETMSQIFEPFFTTKEGIGSGLGLATVHGIVKQSNGFIWVYSEPNSGTTFKIYLPLAAARHDEERPEAPTVAPDGDGETVLLVEDDSQVRKIVREMLATHGYRVLSAENGSEAIALAQDNDIDLVLTDLVMRGLSGRQTAAGVRELQPDVAVLYMSGYTDDGVIRRGALDPGTAFIQKPFGSDDLLRKVRDVMDSQTGAAAGNRNAETRNGDPDLLQPAT